MLGKKQNQRHADFMRLWEDPSLCSGTERLDRLTETTLSDISRQIRGKRAAVAWSGGKDSMVLYHLCASLGIRDGVIGLCRLEYPAFLRWLKTDKPEGISIVNTGQDLAWLSRRPAWLFPCDSKVSSYWFKAVQHRAQAVYFHRQRLHLLLLGRRIADGNYVDRGDGSGIYTAKGVTRYSPLCQWRHEDIFGYIHRHRLRLPPLYQWKDGFIHGTGPWAKRKRRKGETIDEKWRELYRIDKTIVESAQDVFPTARRVFAEMEDKP